MVVNIRSNISMFIVGLSRFPSKEGKTAMLIGDMDIARLMIHAHKVEEDKMMEREDFKNKRAKISRNASR